jgi:hypothetical protein
MTGCIEVTRSNHIIKLDCAIAIRVAYIVCVNRSK